MAINRWNSLYHFGVKRSGINQLLPGPKRFRPPHGLGPDPSGLDLQTFDKILLTRTASEHSLTPLLVILHASAYLLDYCIARRIPIVSAHTALRDFWSIVRSRS